MSPFHASAKLVMIRSGVGRNRSRIQPLCVATHHSTQQRDDGDDADRGARAFAGHAVAADVADGCGSGRRFGGAAAALVAASTWPGALIDALATHARFAHLRRRVDQLQHFLANADELGVGLHRARVAALDEAPAEVELVAVRDAARRRRHHDQLGREEQRLLDAVRDEEEHLLRLPPELEDQLLLLLARQRVERAERLVHQHHFGIARERAREADPLLHAAGDLVHG